jgi:hypothetical protein
VIFLIFGCGKTQAPANAKRRTSGVVRPRMLRSRDVSSGAQISLVVGCAVYTSPLGFLAGSEGWFSLKCAQVTDPSPQQKFLPTVNSNEECNQSAI